MNVKGKSRKQHHDADVHRQQSPLARSVAVTDHQYKEPEEIDRQRGFQRDLISASVSQQLRQKFLQSFFQYRAVEFGLSRFSYSDALDQALQHQRTRRCTAVW